MKFFQVMFILVAMLFFYMSALEIFENGVYGHVELFMLGVFAVIVAQIFKGVEEAMKASKKE